MFTHFDVVEVAAGQPTRILWNAAHDGNVPWVLWKTRVAELCAGASGPLEIALTGQNLQRPADWARWFEASAPLFSAYSAMTWRFDDPALEILFGAAGCGLLGGGSMPTASSAGA